MGNINNFFQSQMDLPKNEVNLLEKSIQDFLAEKDPDIYMSKCRTTCRAKVNNQGQSEIECSITCDI